jgi:hypothetical protein
MRVGASNPYASATHRMSTPARSHSTALFSVVCGSLAYASMALSLIGCPFAG